MTTLREFLKEFTPEKYQKIIENVKKNPYNFQGDELDMWNKDCNDILNIELFDYQKEFLKECLNRGMNANKVENTENTNMTKKEIMANKAANRIKDKWAEYNFSIVNYKPKLTSWGTVNYHMLVVRKIDKIQEIININYDEDSVHPFDISAYVYSDDGEKSDFHWNDILLSLLDEQMNCIDDAVCIMKNPEMMLE